MKDETSDRAPSETLAPDFVAGFCDPARRRLVLIAAILASAMGFIDGAIIAIAIPAMRETLGASLAQVQWIHTSYLLTLSAFTLVGGAAGDRFGLGRVFGLGITLFVAASVVCSFAPTAPTLVAARAAQGLGAALMVPGSLAVITRAYPKDIRGAAIGTWAAASAVTTAAGPILGGLALSLGGPEMWRWIFAINLPLGALALWLVWRAVQRDPGRPGQPVDWIGAGLASVTLGAIAWALTGTEGEMIWGFLWLAVAAFAAFLAVERRHPDPMVDLSLFRARAFAATNLVTLIFYFAFSTIMFFLPMVLIAGWSLSEIEAAAAFAPLSVFIGGFSARAGRLADRIGTRPLLTAGCLVVAVAFAGLALVIPNMRLWTQVLPATTLMGVGMALLVAPLSTAVMASVDEARSGSASGINNALARMAGLFSIAAMGSLAAAVYARADGDLTFGASLGGVAHVAAMNTGLAAITWLSAGLAACAGAIAWIGVPAKP